MPENENDIITEAINYDEVYKDFCVRQSIRYKGKPGSSKGKKASPETRKKLSESHIGYERSKKSCKKQSETLKKLWETKWKLKRQDRFSEEIKNKISKSVSKLVYIHKDDVTKHVKPEILQEFLEQGWVIGVSDKYSKERSEIIKQYNKNKIVSEETKRKQSEAAKNRDPNTRKGPHKSYKYLNNGIINKRAYCEKEEKELLNQGFVHGTINQIRKQEEKLNKSVNEKLWRDSEDQILRENYRKISKQELLKLLPNRNWNSINVRASYLKITRSYKRFNKCRCIETGIIYDSYTEASKGYNISADCISLCCRGITYSAAGLHWELINKGEE